MKNTRILLGSMCFFSIIFLRCEINPYKSGEVLYTNFCSNCHGKNGEGLGALYPPIAGADYLKANSDNLACIIKNGQEGQIIVNGKSYNEVMPANPKLDAVAITNIANYINFKWPYRDEYTTITEVRAQLSSCR